MASTVTYQADSGMLWTWGSNANGAIGVVDEDADGNPLPPEQQRQQAKAPVFVPFFADIPIKTIGCGVQFTVALSQDGQVYSWGSGSMGKLGHPDQRDELWPKMIDFFEGQYVSKIAVGNDHCVALMGGKVYTWGSGFFGRLGHGALKHEYIPKLVDSIEHIPIMEIWAGGCNTYVCDNRYSLWVWGRGMYGQLGIGSVMDSSEPIIIHAFKFSQIFPGEKHVMALDVDGQVYTWGSNEFGQLGDGTKKDCVKPKVIVVAPGDRAISGASGRAHSAVVTRNGKLYVWGSNLEGQLGLPPTVKEKILPERLSLNEKNVLQVSCGDSHTVAITRPDRVWVWGSNKLGQLGIGDGFGEETKTETNANDKSEAVTGASFQEIEQQIGQKKRGVAAVKTPTKPGMGSPKVKPTPKSAGKKAAATPGAQKATNGVNNNAPEHKEVTELWEPQTIRYLRGATTVRCGHFHTVCLLPEMKAPMQLMLDNNMKGLGLYLENRDERRKKRAHEDYDETFYETYYPIHWVTHRGHKDMIQYIQKNTADKFSSITNPSKYTALHIAVRKGHRDCVSLLINLGINVDAQDNYGNTAFHFAASQGDLHLCEILIQHKASPAIQNHYGKKPLDFLSLEKVFKLKEFTDTYDVAIVCDDVDIPFCKQVLEGIEVHHIKCALNEKKKYKNFVKNCKAILFVVSDASVISKECSHNLKEAKDLKKHIYSIWKEKATLNPSLEAIIFRRQLVDFTEANKFRDSISALVAGLRNIFNENANTQDEDVVDSDLTDQDTSTFHPDRTVTWKELTGEKMNYLYICHDHSDHKIALQLAQLLTKHNFICTAFIDNSTVVQDLVIGCWAFLLIVSERSASSNVVRDQIALAENRQKLILPVLVQKTAIQFDPALAYTLARIPKFGFFAEETTEIDVFVNKLVYGIRLAKKVTEKNEKIKELREDVKDAVEKLNTADSQLVDIKAKVATTKKTKI